MHSLTSISFLAGKGCPNKQNFCMRRVYPIGGTILFIYTFLFLFQVDFIWWKPKLDVQLIKNPPGWQHKIEDWSIDMGQYHFSRQDLSHSTNFSKISIAIGIPIAGFASYTSYVDSPLWSHFIPFFVNYTEIPSSKYSHTIFLGYDAGDPLFDVEGVPEQLRKKFYETILQYLIKKNTASVLAYELPVLKVLRVEGTHSPTQAVVAVMKQAYNEGHDYFYQMNDDTLFLTYDWEQILISNLKKSLLFPNFGVTGPVDLHNWDVVTHAFVHRTHLDIFGTFFPTVFKNWFSDDWITEVYGKRFCPRFGDVKVGHIASITRYEPDMSAQKILQQEIDAGRAIIIQWITKNKDSELARIWNITKNAPPGVPNYVALRGQ